VPPPLQTVAIAIAVTLSARTRALGVPMAAVAPAEDFTAALETVEKRTRAAIDALRGLEAIAQSNDPDNAAIPLCLESVINSFEQIRACEANVGGVQVPRDVVENVDQGRNPDAFLAELAERNAAACRATLGKTSAMDALARSVQQRARESGLLAPVPRRTADGPV
jgi:hypothetical protein